MISNFAVFLLLNSSSLGISLKLSYHHHTRAVATRVERVRVFMSRIWAQPLHLARITNFTPNLRWAALVRLVAELRENQHERQFTIYRLKMRFFIYVYLAPLSLFTIFFSRFNSKHWLYQQLRAISWTAADAGLRLYCEAPWADAVVEYEYEPSTQLNRPHFKFN